MSCLFDSLEYFLNIPSIEIRSKICDFLENNKKLFDSIETKDLLELESDNYVKKMRKNSTWGGAIEIKAACNIWNLEIIVCNIRSHDKDDKNNSQIQFIPNDGINDLTKKIYITWNGIHYEPVRNKLNKDKKKNIGNEQNNNSNKFDNYKKSPKKYKIINNKKDKNKDKNKVKNKDQYKKKDNNMFDILFGSDKSKKNNKKNKK
jgi:hypothetical protein